MTLTAIIIILPAAAISFAFGAFYYGALGSSWMAAAGLSEDDVKPDPMLYINAFISILICTAFLYYVIVHAGITGAVGGIGVGLLVSIAVAVTTMNVNHRFQGLPLKLTYIDGGHWVGVMVTQGLVIGVARAYLTMGG